MNLKEELRLELIETRNNFHALLAEIPDVAFSQPSDNPAWTIGEMVFHMSLAPRFMTTDLRIILTRPLLARMFVAFVSVPLFNRVNDFYTRFGARKLTRSFLQDQYDKAHQRALKALDALQESDFQTSVSYPGYDPQLSGVVTVERLFRYIRLHFDSHAAQIRERLGRILV